MPRSGSKLTIDTDRKAEISAADFIACELFERFGAANRILYMRTKRWQRLLATLSLGMIGALALIDYATYAIEGQNGDRLFLGAAQLPHRRVALVLGCAPTLGGRWANPFFVKRMEAAATVYKAGKADYLLVSGDNHTVDYDEPTAMKQALTQLGVPERRIILDYAGFSTSSSAGQPGLRPHRVLRC
jgi:SanA protein